MKSNQEEENVPFDKPRKIVILATSLNLIYSFFVCLQQGQRIVGRCGGYCGTCAPDPKVGLKLDIRIPSP